MKAAEHMVKQLIHSYSQNLANSVIAILIVFLIYIVCLLLFTRKIESHRRKKRLRIRIFYVAMVIVFFILARIWIEGFTHLLAVLGLVSAALVITNKEQIMNLVGWFIILWRGLFFEDDLIQVQQYKGYVKRIGLLYFTIYEVADDFSNSISGRVIRVPNGLVASNALINFSQTSHLLLQTVKIEVDSSTELAYAIDFFKQLVTKVIENFYRDKTEYNPEYLASRNKMIADKIKLNVNVYAEPIMGKAALLITASFYCFDHDALKIKQLIWEAYLEALPKEPKIKTIHA